MPRVHHRKAAKDYPGSGIQKGDMYYTWRIKLQRGGITMRSKTPPRPSQLTASEYYSAALEIQERFIYEKCPDNVEDMVAIRDEAADSARDLGSEQEDKVYNLPEGLQQGPTGELLEERSQAMEEYASELEAVDLEFNEETDLEEWLAEKWGELSSIDLNLE